MVKFLVASGHKFQSQFPNSPLLALMCEHRASVTNTKQGTQTTCLSHRVRDWDIKDQGVSIGF